MFLRYGILVATLVVASGCVEERIVHERRPPPHEYVEVIAPQPPPERVIEVEPAPRPGYVWSRGYWHWSDGRYVPVHGHWVAERPGYRYVHPHWESASDGWHWHAGVWVN
ncbi:YXWGXW repeat-containing protein [Pseudomonas alliivorans]|uniref:YXWGXW repeat-containing protein n=1 Tax=Pseudomonas alliivorans TaxID=2810613 RepID=A0ABS4CCI1_9PSED|nr:MULTISPECIES: YXWGXW repeat-containing protein [Pseudomonas]MBP0939127.1 YXWGXW repeat-containing protein [Pseudomonas alliivorans]MBP0948413.1 YXWGXW repeat-containing protein [Pseudomonas alliivorans]MBP0952626.1 YXWGXW repeat-containing protein [Pseudomonas alliivorans]MCD5982552.1 YXWGXW repeat-containing protein [Pseudomonas sp. CDFA 610]MCO5364000.1 YXWGXW repeat-containing protein [Pseudomonas alliivorans]